MKTYSALEVRRQFGRILDEAAAGDRIVIERAGQPIAGLVPIADLEVHDPDRRRVGQLEAFARIRRLASETRSRHGPLDAAAATRADRARDDRTADDRVRDDPSARTPGG